MEHQQRVKVCECILLLFFMCNAAIGCRSKTVHSEGHYSSPNKVWHVDFDFDQGFYTVTHVKKHKRGFQTIKCHNIQRGNVLVYFDGDKKVFVFDSNNVSEFGENDGLGTYFSTDLKNDSLPYEMKKKLRKIQSLENSSRSETKESNGVQF